MDDRAIDWKVVNEKLRCPICGDKAFIEAATDGTRGTHTHHFELTREHARELCRPTCEEIDAEIATLERRLNTLRELRHGR